VTRTYVYGLSIYKGRKHSLVPPTPETTEAHMLKWQQFVEYELGIMCWLIRVEFANSDMPDMRCA
jgi:hypothetical protein